MLQSLLSGGCLGDFKSGVPEGKAEHPPNALVVLERAAIQALLDEMALTSSGYAEPATGARAGRLLSAEHVFQGVLTTLGENDLQTDVDILNVVSTALRFWSTNVFTVSVSIEARPPLLSYFSLLEMIGAGKPAITDVVGPVLRRL